MLTRDGWIKRVGRLASVEGTRVREGDAVIAVVPGSTLDHVIFFADDGTAYTMRINEVPASSGYGEPITKFFKLDDQVRIIGAATTDERFIDCKPSRRARTIRQGRTCSSHRAAARRCGCRSRRIARHRPKRAGYYTRLREGDKVVLAKVLGQYRWVEGKRTKIEEESMFLVSTDGHVIHFRIEEVNVLSGAGRGVIGIKLDDDDTCIGGALVSRAIHEDGRGNLRRHQEGIRRRHADRWPRRRRQAGSETHAVRADLPPPIDLTDWEAIEVAAEKNGKAARAEWQEERVGCLTEWSDRATRASCRSIRRMADVGTLPQR